MTSPHPSQLASSRTTIGHQTPPPPAMPPELMVKPFPEPGPTIRTAMEHLQQATVEPPADEEALRELAEMPRPWDPGTCTGRTRTELWSWLDLVAMWVNEQHLWNVTRTGIPECWPQHPHLVNDLAVLACGRYYTSFAVTPAALEDWHRYTLPGFLERLRDRLGEGCQPSKHQPRPRHERDEAQASTTARRARRDRFQADREKAGARTTGPSKTPAEPASDDHASDDLHQRW